MKKTLLYILAFTFAFSTYAAGHDTDPKNNKDNDGRLAPMKIRDRSARPDIPGSFIIDIGWNLLQDAPDNMETSIIIETIIKVLCSRKL